MSLPSQELLQGHGSTKICTDKVWLENCQCYGKTKGRNRLGTMQKAEKLKQQLHGSDSLVLCQYCRSWDCTVGWMKRLTELKTNPSIFLRAEFPLGQYPELHEELCVQGVGPPLSFNWTTAQIQQKQSWALKRLIHSKGSYVIFT